MKAALVVHLKSIMESSDHHWRKDNMSCKECRKDSLKKGLSYKETGSFFMERKRLRDDRGMQDHKVYQVNGLSFSPITRV